MSIAVDKLGTRMKHDFGYHSIEFDFPHECRDFVKLVDKKICVLTITQSSGKYEISGSKSTTNQYAVMVLKTGHARLMLRIPSAQKLSVVKPSNIIFKLSDVYALGQLYNMQSSGPTDFIQRVRKAVKRAFRMKSSPVEEKFVTDKDEKLLKNLLKIQATPEKKPKKRSRTESLPARVPSKPAKRRQVKSASNSLRAPRIDAPPEVAPPEVAPPEAPLAEAPLAEDPLEIPPPEAISAERKHSRSIRVTEALVPAPHVTTPEAVESVPAYPVKRAKSLTFVPKMENRTNFIHSDPRLYKQKYIAGRKLVQQNQPKQESQAEVNPVREHRKPQPPHVHNFPVFETKRNQAESAVIKQDSVLPQNKPDQNPHVTKPHLAVSTWKSEDKRALLVILSERLLIDISNCVDRSTLGDTQKQTLQDTLRNKSAALLNEYVENFLSSVSQHTKNISTLNRDTINYFYQIWLTCYFNIETFFIREGFPYKEVKDLYKYQCALTNQNNLTKAPPSTFKKHLVSKYRKIIRDRIKEYVYNYISDTKIKALILGDLDSETSSYLLRFIDGFVSTVKTQSDEEIAYLFNIWFTCYFDILKYFNMTCKYDSKLIKQLSGFRTPHTCSIFNIDKRRRSFISQTRIVHKPNKNQHGKQWSAPRPLLRYIQTSDNGTTNLLKNRRMKQSKQQELINELVIMRQRNFNDVKTRLGDVNFLTQSHNLQKIKTDINDFVLCFVVNAYVASQKNKTFYTVKSYLNIWHEYVRLTKNVLSFKAKSDAVRVLNVWKMLKSIVVVYTKEPNQKYKIRMGIMYKEGSNNFLYDIAHTGKLNCAGATSMLYALIKTVDPTIDIRTVVGFGHTLIAIGNDIVLDTTIETTLYSLTEYQRNQQCLVFVNPINNPNGLLNECEKLFQASILNGANDECYDTLELFGIGTKSNDVQIRLFSWICKLNKLHITNEDCENILRECVDILNAIVSKIYTNVSFTSNPCLCNIVIFQKMQLLIGIKRVLHWKGRQWGHFKKSISLEEDAALELLRLHQLEHHKIEKPFHKIKLICFKYQKP